MCQRIACFFCVRLCVLRVVSGVQFEAMKIEGYKIKTSPFSFIKQGRILPTRARESGEHFFREIIFQTFSDSS